MSASVEEHREAAPDSVRCAVITVSDSRTKDDDKSGRVMIESLQGAGHELIGYEIIKDDPSRIGQLLDKYADDPECQAILFNGGTGIAQRDSTYDVIAGKLEKTLPGFGELFRMLSYEEIGAAAMLTRATAGVYRGRLVFSTPGSSNAVKLAMNELITEELSHLVYEAIK
ncbi:MAG: MogA/MoaB family molybdenum cofactor biosynthesis protein [Chloroflexota bacterium]